MSEDFAAELVERYRVAYRIAWRYLDTREDVEDAVQSAMAKALTYRNTEVRNIDAWFKSVVYSVCVDALRRRRPDPVDLDDLDDTPIADHDVDTATLRETIDELQQALTDDQWQILTMYADGYSFKEIGQARGIKTGTARAVAFRGRQRANDWRNSTGWIDP